MSDGQGVNRNFVIDSPRSGSLPDGHLKIAALQVMSADYIGARIH
jgi:hypothetical protein